jgi:predicted metal-dependent HD superfamily phosphohydrolase
MIDFISAKEFILDKLKTGLNPDLFYHCYNHTLDVYNSAVRLATLEKIDKKDLILLETAALFHDSGFLLGYKDHEDESIEFTKIHLPEFGYTDAEIVTICSMILATKLPQSPKTKLEKILCDADLDYLGRDDFFMIANQLLCEWNVNGIPTTLKKWYHIQVDFLSHNDYFTKSAKNLRVEKKKKNLSQILDLLTKN